MDVVSGLVFVCLFLIALCAITHYFRNSPLPVVCWIVLFGVVYGAVQKFTLTELPWVHLSPDVILYIFLPVLIFDSSRKLHEKEAHPVAIPSGLLASLGILLSMFVMAAVIRPFAEVPWLHLLFFCSIMSATDPVAVSAIFRLFPIPERLKMLVEGESLINDGTVVILFSLLYGKVIEGRADIRKGLDGVYAFIGRRYRHGCCDRMDMCDSDAKMGCIEKPFYSTSHAVAFCLSRVLRRPGLVGCVRCHCRFGGDVNDEIDSEEVSGGRNSQCRADRLLPRLLGVPRGILPMQCSSLSS